MHIGRVSLGEKWRNMLNCISHIGVCTANILNSSITTFCITYIRCFLHYIFFKSMYLFALHFSLWLNFFSCYLISYFCLYIGFRACNCASFLLLYLPYLALPSNCFSLCLFKRVLCHR